MKVNIQKQNNLYKWERKYNVQGEYTELQIYKIQQLTKLKLS